jgi:hypothetical protein
VEVVFNVPVILGGTVGFGIMIDVLHQMVAISADWTDLKIVK